MKRLFFMFLVSIGCASGEVKPDVEGLKSNPARETERMAEIPVLEDSIKEEGVRHYTSGRYIRPLDKGSVILLIHGISDSTCEFVFDTGANTPYFAKIAGEILVNENGRATFSDHLCKTLDFQFTVDGISVKEYECATFHSEKIAFDGFYTRNK